jgi:NAD(P)H-hydrate epimerase
MKVVTAEQMGNIDRSAADLGIPTEILMENAGRAVAEETRKLISNIITKHILIITGPGNNGGDGLVAARYLSDFGAEVSLYLCSQRSAEDKNLALVQERGISIINVKTDENFKVLDSLLTSSDLVIDAIFGTGRSRIIEGIFKQILDRLITAKQRNPLLHIVAVDMPSGLDANTGAVDPSCPQVNATITLGYPKPGLYNFPGAENAGKVIIADIGIPPALAEDIKTELITEEWVKTVLPERPLNANKGTFGKLLVIAGSINYVGAAYLACMGAARIGTGLVTLGTAKSLQPILASKLTEVTYIPLPEIETGIISPEAVPILQEHLPQYNVILIGCGLGQNSEIVQFIKSFLLSGQANIPADLVLDADALNTISDTPEWWQKLNRNVILTPHPGEMSRLTGISIENIQNDRLEITRKAAMEWQKLVVLKGAHTIIAAPDGEVKISEVANPGLASAGTGDVLSGIIAGLSAQGLGAFEAASCGVYLHSQAGNIIMQEVGDAGMLASDLLDVLPVVIKEIKQTTTPLN